MTRTSRKGFTLIELIVTIVILGILAALAVPAFQAVIERSRENAVVQAGNGIAREAHALAAFDQTATVAAALLPGTGADADADSIADELEADFPGNVVVTALGADGLAVSATNAAKQLLVEQGDYEVVVNLDVAAGNHDAAAVTAAANTTAGAKG